MDLQADEKCKTIFKQTISGPLVHENTLSYTRVARRQVKIPKAERVDKNVKYRMEDKCREICMIMDLKMLKEELEAEIIDIMEYHKHKQCLQRFYSHYEIPYFSKKHHLHPKVPEEIAKACFHLIEQEFNYKKHNPKIYDMYIKSFEVMSIIDDILDDIDKNIFKIIEDPNKYVFDTLFSDNRDLFKTINACVKKYLKVEKIDLTGSPPL